ncbi:hypothetical protein GCM10023081_17360 [Arthrobacter ginkgonis]|uniref:Uncharacterized protein n=1 Tax=Arthrobacter ginkgonis TaxID=1630594 RepID=A0ABP7C797_9MICC
MPRDTGADLYVSGAPAHGFSATPAIRKAVAQMPFLDGKRVVLIATEFFKTPRAVPQLRVTRQPG